MLIFSALSVLLSCAFGVVIISCNQLSDVRQFQVAEVSPGLELCALDGPSVSLSLDSVLDCALQCQRFSYCENFNYDILNKTCEIFFGRPKCYEPSLSCVHFQIQEDQPYVGIPGENCSLPFTYGGRLYNGCAKNLTFDGCKGCLLRNRTRTTCFGTYVASFVTVNVTIPTFTTYTPLMSINNWIVIQQRVDGSLSFNQSWIIYRNGFGSIANNFWLGLEKMHQLTINAPYRLRIELQSMDNDKWFSVEYNSFFITSESLGYALNVSGYVGDAGDALNSKVNSGVFFQNGMKFSTSDRDNTPTLNRCAATYECGFWHKACFYTCLNCKYATFYGFTWSPLVDLQLCKTSLLKTSRMMIKRV